MEPEDHSNKEWGWLQWLVVGILLIVAAIMVIPMSNGVAKKAPMMQSANNARQVLISLKSYAGDNNGKYPEGPTSNDAFRELFIAGLIDDERAFTAYNSPYEPDNDIGVAPHFDEAVCRNENHWAMTKGLTDSSPGDVPLVFENPIDPTWPPYWNARISNQRQPGRAWKGGKIIIGRNDGSINGEQLTDKNGERVTLAPVKNGKNLFDLAGPHEVMDVAK